MKAVILAGGFGTRISEESHLKPKPMVEIGGRPILWHVMKTYSHYGIQEFIICLGYKSYVIKEYFANYFLHMSDVTFDMKYNQMQIHNNKAEPWRITLVDTGEHTMTGGRMNRIKGYVGHDDFCLTYGDGVADLDIAKLIKFHQSHGLLATVTAVQPSGRFGAMDINGDQVLHFQEKPKGDSSWINGGFFVLSPKIFSYIDGDDSVWEREPLERLAEDGQLAAYKHSGFWQPMDTMRDKNQLEQLWASDDAPWKKWT